MAELEDGEREKLKKSEFAYVDSSGEGHLPIHDESHARNAISRWNQTQFETVEDKEKARKAVLRAARTFNIDVDPDDKVSHTARSLRPARTKAGPRGGKKDDA